ncbi:alpha-ketoglutarate-dependent dioxygenase FTO isoform X3 [Pristis pectinata]|uniref:alpha-ketoglutarate-dependent dioxygenase FTO isoform X3 n=1 Tax=Pristis pectinata TaxID=685728 RepID=UPI00223E81FA|nr:alpha-ketoglutarate-dependent dioxygenase FTO isoform X3 [Pristis pectinata]
MKRFSKYDNAKEIKRQKLLREIGDQKLPYLTPKDVEFQQLSKAKYSKLHLRQASCVPEEIHQKVQQGLTALRDYKCFAQDLVQIKGKDVLTPVYRLLVGNPGHTYRYLDTRLFAIPWPTHGVEVKYSSDEIGKACQAIKDLNEYFNAEAVKILLDHYSAVNKEMGFVEKTTTSTSVEGSESVKGVHYSQQNNADTALKNRTSFNVALLNYMDPSKMKYLKEEPYFGMGKMAVSWHRDENLVERSTVAVYNYSCDDDLNMTHQHCVLSGMQSRFSSTHRVAECSSGTLDYIFGRCDVAMKNLQKDSTLGISFLTSLDLEFVRQTEEIHNEVEFEWLRQFWFQGKRSAKQSDWWFGPMAVLENSWKEMEQMTKLLLCEINKTGWSFEEKQKIIRCLLPLLEERQELRKIWTVRCQSRLANNLPIDEQPECRPYWHEGDPNMPLPFDLEEIISLLRNQLLHEDEGDKN